MRVSLFSLILAIGMFGLSCKSRLREVSCPDLSPSFKFTEGEEREKLSDASFLIDHVSLKAKVTQSDGRNEQSFQLNLRMIEDSIIWASVTALGIEGARILVDRDSFQMVDRLNKTYYKAGLSYFEELLGQRFSLVEIQDLLVGNPNSRLLHGKFQENALLGAYLEYNGGNYLLKGNFNDCLRLTRYSITGADSRQRVDVRYDRFLRIKKRGLLPGTIVIQAQDGDKKLDLTIEYQSVNQEPIENVSFQIPARYERKF
ncbi:MAG: DUF4292 domain-containing protein [Flavobacteriales bacterium]|nr:DUF4292 domain-containing protein [Flavobacteriales bacterium]